MFPYFTRALKATILTAVAVQVVVAFINVTVFKDA